MIDVGVASATQASATHDAGCAEDAPLRAACADVGYWANQPSLASPIRLAVRYPEVRYWAEGRQFSVPDLSPCFAQWTVAR